jgi:two-component system LytT family response regulator
MTALIIDDEKHCRDVLLLLLQKNCPGVQVLDTCVDGPSGIQAIERHRPDLVFLDIEMPGMNGFDMLSQCRYHQFKLIFTTAYDEYAIQAIRHNALDYLLKPVDKDELMKAVQRASESTGTAAADRIEQLLQQVQPQKTMGKVALPTLEGLLFINPDDIYYCESDGG